MATAGILSVILSQAASISDTKKRDEFVKSETQGRYLIYTDLFNEVVKLQRSSERTEDLTLSEDRKKHDKKVADQIAKSAGDDGTGIFNLKDEPTPRYGYTETEWIAKSENERDGIRRWAHDQADRFITNAEAQAWTNYISSKPSSKEAFDGVYGIRYKYKSLFQSSRDVSNRSNFEAVEGEIDAISQSRGYIKYPAIESSEQLRENINLRNTSYSGCDIIPSITVGSKTFVMGNISTISYSIHRDKVPVRTLGRTYAKSYVSGGATIAGSLVFTVFDTHVLDAVRREVVSEVQAAGGQSSPLTQQLPPFDITIFFQNEYGHSSYMRIYGVEISDEAQTHSINDIYSENVMQYVARDIDLMCKVGDVMSPVNMAGNNVTFMDKFRMYTPNYKLGATKDNDAKIGRINSEIARINNEIKNTKTKLAELQKSGQTAEVINQTNALNIQLKSLEQAAIDKGTQIKNIEIENEKLSIVSTESMTQDAEYQYGSPSSNGRDDPYALTRAPMERQTAAPTP